MSFIRYRLSLTYADAVILPASLRVNSTLSESSTAWQVLSGSWKETVVTMGRMRFGAPLTDTVHRATLLTRGHRGN